MLMADLSAQLDRRQLARLDRSAGVSWRPPIAGTVEMEQ
jgi:hypothetical protein